MRLKCNGNIYMVKQVTSDAAKRLIAFWISDDACLIWHYEDNSPVGQQCLLLILELGYLNLDKYAKKNTVQEYTREKHGI